MDCPQQLQRSIASHYVIQHVKPRILHTTAANFTRTSDEMENRYYQERPMMLNAWTQTTFEDFSYLQCDEAKKQEENQIQKELRDKICVLEESLRQHTEILSQIHATSARKDSIQTQQRKLKAQQQEETQQHHYTPPTPPVYRMLTPPNSVINAVHHISPTPTESIKYKIIAEANGDGHGEPIEIQLSEDDGALKLNSSADSDRLEICLGDDKQDEVKSEMQSANVELVQKHPESFDSTPTHFIKRRKIDTKNNLNTNNDTNFRSSMPTGVLQSRDEISSKQYSHKVPTTQQQTSRKSSNASLLKTPIPNSLSNPQMDNVMVSIGPNNTRVPARVFENITWNSASISTRKLLMAVFDRHTLATHSMTGKPSPAFKDHNKPLKRMLDPLAIQDIIFAVTRKCDVSEKEVRNAITTKCADENKMMKLQQNRRDGQHEELDKENRGQETSLYHHVN